MKLNLRKRKVMHMENNYAGNWVWFHEITIVVSHSVENYAISRKLRMYKITKITIMVQAESKYSLKCGDMM